MHWKATKWVRGVKGCPDLFPPGASEPEHHQSLNIQLQQWPGPTSAECGNASQRCCAGSSQAGAGASPFLPGNAPSGSASPLPKDSSNIISGNEGRRWKISLSFALYRLKTKRLPRGIIFTPLNTTLQIYILSLFDSKDVLLPYFFWNGNSIMCGWTLINYIPVWGIILKRITALRNPETLSVWFLSPLELKCSCSLPHGVPGLHLKPRMAGFFS